MNRLHEQLELDADLRALDEQLCRTMPIHAPAGLAERIYEATVDDLGAANEGSAVIGRIGPTWRTWAGFAAAVAASVALAAVIWLVGQTGTANNNTIAGTGELSDGDLQTIALALDGSFSDSALSEKLDNLEFELDALATAMGGQSGDSTNLWDDLSTLETQLRQF